MREKNRPLKVISLVLLSLLTMMLVGCSGTLGGEPERPSGNGGGSSTEGFIYSGTKSITITGYNGTERNVSIPASINGKPVIAIGDRAFNGKKLTSVTIPNSVTSIGHWAFGYNQLTSVTIPNKVTSIGAWAFSPNQMTSVTIGNSVTSIGPGAFASNQLTSVTIPNSVTLIDNRAFTENQLSGVINIPNSVTSIGGWSFCCNPNLTAINVSSGNRNYSSTDGVLYNKNGTVLLIWPARKTGSATIPSSVTSIGRGAFCGNQMSSITIPNGITSIEDGAFYNNQLTSVTIPNSVTSIGYDAFCNNQLTSVTIGANVTLAQNGSFPDGFDDAYNNGGKLAGTYTRPNTSSTTWTRR